MLMIPVKAEVLIVLPAVWIGGHCPQAGQYCDLPVTLPLWQRAVAIVQ